MESLTLPKIDLHLHLDGALRTATILDLARLQNHPLPARTVPELDRLVRVSPECRSLSEFLATFDVFYPLLKNPAALRRIATELVLDLTADGVMYAEVRFAPVLNIPDPDDRAEAPGAMRAAIEAVLEGLTEGLWHAPNLLGVNLILCCYRGVPVDLARTTVEIAAEFHRAGGPGPQVCGVDLAGDESRYPASDFQAVFDLARTAGLSVTVHAAEGAGPESARDAIERLHARRIGHGVRIREDPDLLEKVIKEEIALEMCLTSNLQTATVPTLAEHPFRDYLDGGVRVTLNTDDPGVSAITLSHEWDLATRQFALSRDERRQILTNSARAAFVDPSLREKLLGRLDAWFRGPHA